MISKQYETLRDTMLRSTIWKDAAKIGAYVEFWNFECRKMVDNRFMVFADAIGYNGEQQHFKVSFTI